LLSKFLPGVAHVHNLHPLIIHFPIAFLIGAVLLYGTCWVWPSDTRAWAGYWVLILGFWSCYLAMLTGILALMGVSLSPSVRQELLLPHMNWMILTCFGTTLLAAWAIADKPFPRKGRWGFVVLHLVLLAVMARGADYGSRLVYDYNAAGNAVQSPLRFSK
jgi:uncharacterized membrane protein